MSKLSELAWKRNSLIGRLVRVDNQLLNLLLTGDQQQILTEGEIKTIQKCVEEIDKLIYLRDHNWTNIKDEYIKKNGE